MWASDSRRHRRLARLVLTALLVTTAAGAEERILAFDSAVVIDADASLVVTERIRVRAEGQDIRRGIYRDFPTRYRDRLGNRYRVEFQLLAARRDGQDEAWHTEQRANGIRVYLGRSDRLLQPGEYVYTLRYATRRQLGFFDDFDELYWNVTGNGWPFPIDSASARVELPATVDWHDLRLAAYTGQQGAAETDAETRIASGQVVEFKATRGLRPREGLTIAVGWPKGLVREPRTLERIGSFFGDNGGALALLVGLLAPLAWYLWAWRHYGRDPARGVIIPRFEPPSGLSPAACRYVRDMVFRSDAFTAAVISLAIKGYLSIEERENRFVLYRRKSPQPPTASPGEQALYRVMLTEPDAWVELDNENHALFNRARSALQQALKAEYQGRLFKLNSIYMVPAVILSVLAAAAAAGLAASWVIWILFGLLTLGMHAVFLFLMRAPTPSGRRVMDEIEGFARYLDTAERARLDAMRSPELTPEVFEAFLPYAFALGVENGWCERLAREFPREVAEGRVYTHDWYHGNFQGQVALHHLGQSFGHSFTSAIAAASSPPGSASGSGGGGFSGGGGGGGGGGGW